MKKLKMLAIDLGASSGRGIVGTFDGERFELAENHRFPNEPVIAAGQFTWDVLRIFNEIKNSVRACALSSDKDICSIGIDTWGVDFGLLDKNGHLLSNPTHYRDKRNEGMPEYAFKTVSRDEIYKKTGIQIINFNTLFQLLAVQKNDPELLGIAHDMLFMPDLLNYFLTGVKQTEYTIASTSQMLDAGARDWSYELLDKFGLPRGIFGKIVEPGTYCGELLPGVKEEVGDIKAHVVSVAAHDTASAVVAVPSQNDKFIFVSSGTWSIMGTEIKKPFISDKTSEYNFTNEGGYNKTWRFSKNITGLWVEQESKRQWEREGKKYTYDGLSELALASKPMKYLIDPDDPRFAGPGNIPARIAEYCRESGQGTPETTGEIVRCIFDSLSMRYRWTVEKIDELCGEKIPQINIVGGGIKEKMLSQFAANACGRPVVTGPVEATAIGNIAAQAIASGEISDISQARQVVANSFPSETFEPTETSLWDAGYEKFLKLIK